MEYELIENKHKKKGKLLGSGQNHVIFSQKHKG